MRRRYASRRWLITCLVMSILWFSVGLFAGVVLSKSGAQTACAEDAPCWNWATMGNHKRGVFLTNGRLLVVGPASFDGIRRERRIDWSRTPHLLGDRRSERR